MDKRTDTHTHTRQSLYILTTRAVKITTGTGFALAECFSMLLSVTSANKTSTMLEDYYLNLN